MPRSSGGGWTAGAGDTFTEAMTIKLLPTIWKSLIIMPAVWQFLSALKPVQCQTCRQNCCNLAEADWIGQKYNR